MSIKTYTVQLKQQMREAARDKRGWGRTVSDQCVVFLIS